MNARPEKQIPLRYPILAKPLANAMRARRSDSPALREMRAAIQRRHGR